MNINQDYLFGQTQINMMKLGTMTPIGITVHNTYNSAPAINEAKNQFNNNTKKGDKGVAVHFYVDENNIYQLLPLNIHGWHAGDGVNGNGNRKTIAIEICRSTDYSDDKYKRAEDLTIKLIEKLLKDFNFSTNAIYQHEYWSGKKCPHRLIEGNPRTWETFINLIGKDLQPEKPIEKPPVNDVTNYQRPKGTYQEKGGWARFTNTCGTFIYKRDFEPSTKAKVGGQLLNKDYFDYIDVWVGNGHVWIGNGKEWLPTRELDKNGKPKPIKDGWGTYGSIPKDKPKPTKEYIFLKPTADSWALYPLGVPLVKRNAKATLNPKKFDGLEYEILGRVTNGVTIETRDYGKGNIYIGNDVKKYYDIRKR